MLVSASRLQKTSKKVMQRVIIRQFKSDQRCVLLPTTLPVPSLKPTLDLFLK